MPYAKPKSAKAKKALRANSARWREKHPDRAKRAYANHRLKKLYDLSIEQRDQLLAAQGGACHICKTKTPNHKFGWAVDHNHKTGFIRGILCNNCNMMLGFAKDQPDRLITAAEYLIRAREEEIRERE